jgi:hypothetical protein
MYSADERTVIICNRDRIVRMKPLTCDLSVMFQHYSSEEMYIQVVFLTSLVTYKRDSLLSKGEFM